MLFIPFPAIWQKRIQIAKASFIIRTLPSVEESHLIGGNTLPFADLVKTLLPVWNYLKINSRLTIPQRIYYLFYVFGAAILLKHSRFLRLDTLGISYSLFLRIRDVKNNTQLFLPAHPKENIYFYFVIILYAFLFIFPRCPKRTSGKLLSI